MDDRIWCSCGEDIFKDLGEGEGGGFGSMTNKPPFDVTFVNEDGCKKCACFSGGDDDDGGSSIFTLLTTSIQKGIFEIFYPLSEGWRVWFLKLANLAKLAKLENQESIICDSKYFTYTLIEDVAAPRLEGTRGLVCISAVVQTYDSEQRHYLQAAARDDPYIDWTILKQQSDLFVIVASLDDTGGGRRIRGVSQEASRRLQSGDALSHFLIMRADSIQGSHIGLAAVLLKRQVMCGRSRLVIVFCSDGGSGAS